MSRWFRHYAGMARDDKIVRAALKAKQPVERAIWVWAAILESAAEIDDGGRFELDITEVSYFLRTEESDISSLVAALEAGGRISGDRVVKWSDRQFQSDRSAERQRRLREKRKASGDADGERCDEEHAHHGDEDVTSLSRHGDAPETETEADTKTEGNSLRSFPARATRNEPTMVSPDWKPKNPQADPAEVKRFVAYNIAKGVLMADWDAAWVLWLDRKAEREPQPKAHSPPAPTTWLPAADPRWADAAGRYQRERGKPLRAFQSKHFPEIGAAVPTDWLEPRAH